MPLGSAEAIVEDGCAELDIFGEVPDTKELEDSETSGLDAAVSDAEAEIEGAAVVLSDVDKFVEVQLVSAKTQRSRGENPHFNAEDDR
jgi:hypothetical protein